jgi:hypothetical protein
LWRSRARKAGFVLTLSAVVALAISGLVNSAKTLFLLRDIRSFEKKKIELIKERDKLKQDLERERLRQQREDELQRDRFRQRELESSPTNPNPSPRPSDWFDSRRSYVFSREPSHGKKKA